MKLIFILISILISAKAQLYSQIKNYKVSYCIATGKDKNFIGLRSFEDNLNRKFLLLVNPETLETKVDLQNNYKTTASSIQSLSTVFNRSAYFKALSTAAINDGQLQNAGITSINTRQNGINLTIDLCPSKKPLDRVVFQSIFNEFKKVEQPAPIAVSVSGKWMLKHTDDLNWLKSLVSEGELAITWINHTYNHEVNNLPLDENFLLTAKTDLNVEILENEKLMLINGIIPSVFFRFPGLISDAQLVKKVEKYGLIPIGSDAWLAKGEPVKNGSIVLIHANGNEELGVTDFIKLLKQNKFKVMNRSWFLLDLSNSLKIEEN